MKRWKDVAWILSPLSSIPSASFLTPIEASSVCLNPRVSFVPPTPFIHPDQRDRGYVMESRSSCCRLMCINEPACLQKQRWGKWENTETWKQQTLIPGEFHVSCYLHILMECVQCHSFSGMQSAVHWNIRRFCTVPMEMLIPKEKTNQRAKLNTIQTVTVSDWFLSHSETNTLCPIKRK